MKKGLFGEGLLRPEEVECDNSEGHSRQRDSPCKGPRVGNKYVRLENCEKTKGLKVR